MVHRSFGLTVEQIDAMMVYVRSVHAEEMAALRAESLRPSGAQHGIEHPAQPEKPT